MEKSVYVKGNIINESCKFKYKECWDHYDKPIPDGSTIIEKDLIIDANYKSSFFTTYYATGGITTHCESDYFIPCSLESIRNAFDEDVSNMKRLLKSYKPEDELKEHLYRLIYIGMIGILEKTLFEILVYFVFNSQESFDKYLDKQTASTVSLRNCKQIAENIEDAVYKNLCDILCHQLNKVKNIVEGLGKKFPNVDSMNKYINVRHDLVHRNGRSKTAKPIVISKCLLEKEIRDIKKFVGFIFNNN